MRNMKKWKSKYKVVFVLLVAALIISCVGVTKEWLTGCKEKKTFDELEKLITVDENQKKAESQKQGGRNMGLLFELNKNCVGWICIPHTKINYPVMYTPDNSQQYLRQDFYGKYSQSGTPFIDGRCRLGGDNIIIYGHNMNNGTMFADLKKYAESGYGKANQIVEFQTSSGKDMYTIIAVVTTNTSDEWYNFITADTDEEFNEYVAGVRKRSIYELQMPDKYERQLITMSTCYGSDQKGRLLVIAVKNK